ncbi:protein of unknown function [Bradyrhizobium vignae]|uniref:Uncharacterized protein n=1 Tax=Bradyrhizobium vignae TaxID=1549949 RepID=A0A2U3Q1Z8_9BRAD|nr:protein of unknown function [Bradyrhizobium vignae]
MRSGAPGVICPRHLVRHVLQPLHPLAAGWCRRMVTRYDRLAANYPAFVQLASIRLWLRLNEFASWKA